MATYYKWRKSTIAYSEKQTEETEVQLRLPSNQAGLYEMYGKPSITSDGRYDFSDAEIDGILSGSYSQVYYGNYAAVSDNPKIMYTAAFEDDRIKINRDDNIFKLTSYRSKDYFYQYEIRKGPGTFQSYVYSTDSSAYPNGGVSGDYYYDQRTTVTSPTAPTGLTYPATITTPSVDISWTAATSNTNYPVSGYQVDVSVNGGTSWTTAGTPSTNSLSYSIPAGTTSIMFRVRAKDSNGQWGSYVTGTQSQVLLAPTLTIPQMVMQGQPATISWTEVDGADSYTLQRKSSADTDWTQVYSGANLSYTETVGTWTSLQYRVQGVSDGTGGGWATSDSIQIVSASALVISGTDGDLGTLTNDVQYSISSDQTSPTIDVTVEVNGGEYASFQATSGESYSVGVLDLPTGTGSIVITATTTVSSSPVSVTRTWTYSKTAQTFPSAGSVGQLTQEGAVVWPETLAEAIRTGMTPWGGNLSTALDLLSRAALYNRTQTPKYNEVTVSLSGKTEGQIIQLPENGKMVEFYVAKLDYESALNGAGRVLLVRKGCYDDRAWDSGGVNAWASSDLLAWLNGTYKALFSEEVQTAMGSTTYYYTPGNNNDAVTTRSDAVFALSMTELGKSNRYANEEGSVLPIASTLQIAYQNGSPTFQWTRSPVLNSTSTAWRLDFNSTGSSQSCDDFFGSRPIFTLPSTFTYGPVYVDQAGTIHPSQEYTPAGDWLDVWGNAIPAVKIETGSYVGTGTYGQDNPTVVTLPFSAKCFMAQERKAEGDDNTFYRIIIIDAGVTMVENSVGGAILMNVSAFSEIVSWWVSPVSGDNAVIQLNKSGTTYDFVAIG